MKKKNKVPKIIKSSKLTKEDGQLVKLEENKILNKDISAALFMKDVNDLSERGHD